ncbi:methylenetetrahydrofolate dehydrogenase (NAD+) [Microbotryum lychnidis-dioicae p1A1 Lamole]|uniref:Methylenetetrahydrofolate dehydrogenase (NAD+) n=1 Tax=Microbotryum lychnidis-dioicae (strain p1A1 Lamole / MvSl-1064) TaxID=683840 RepID=U5GXW9_USTV1|nr:methylenetetrahydrofolate dehydrogenase (NAD+) [Microbotryum lychnidis-dioicae p1A1 Lamole]|eukprot:KDE09638.1 methylenetetrahydrofolate dehydrogenase (NAD+) [Microbotryum lychnidis-dioicae p1A1 Lamole]
MSIEVPTTLCATVTGEAVAKPFRAAIIATTSTSSPRPKLVGLLANSNAPSRAYAEWTAKACQAVGINYELREVGAIKKGQDHAVAEQGEVEEAILEANADDEVHGIMVYYPIFGPRQDGYLQQAVSPLKDVEGLNFTWLFSLYHNTRFIDPRKIALAAQVVSPPAASTSGSGPAEPELVKAILPCTPLAIVKTLEHCQVYNPVLPYGSRAFGKTITVINRSEVVGRPLAALLANDGARVFSVDLDGIQEFTRRRTSAPAAEGEKPRPSFQPRHFVQSTPLKLEDCLAISDVVVSGVPSAAYKISTDALKEGVIAVNFSESKNFETNIKEKASIYCPGIGKATIVLLQRNLLRLREYQDILKGIASSSE